MPKKKARRASPPNEPHWLQQSAHRIDQAGRYLILDAQRRFLRPEHGEELLRASQASGSGDPAGGPPRCEPPRITSNSQEAQTIWQVRAWGEQFVWPDSDGIRPIRQPQTPNEEKHALVAGLSHALSFCPARRAVMICGRPVVVQGMKKVFRVLFTDRVPFSGAEPAAALASIAQKGIECVGEGKLNRGRPGLGESSCIAACFAFDKALVLTHELETPANLNSYLVEALSPVRPLYVFGRSWKATPACRFDMAIWYFWKDRLWAAHGMRSQ